MKTNCPMKMLLQELIDSYPAKPPHECCAILVMKLLSDTHNPPELIEAIRKEFDKNN